MEADGGGGVAVEVEGWGGDHGGGGGHSWRIWRDMTEVLALALVLVLVLDLVFGLESWDYERSEEGNC